MPQTASSLEPISRLLIDLYATLDDQRFARVPGASPARRELALKKFEGAAEAAAALGLPPAADLEVAAAAVLKSIGHRPQIAELHDGWNYRAVGAMTERLASFT